MEKSRKPKIRFKGYNDDWEQRKFGEMADYKKGPFGSALKKDIFVPKSDNSVKVYEQQNAINKNWKLERYFITKEYATELKAFETHSGDILVSCAGTIGEMYELPSESENGVINQALMRVRVNDKVVSKKIYQLLFSNMINDFSREHSNGSAMKNIPPFADLKSMNVVIPSLEEQVLIEECFQRFDNLITLHQRKLDKLVNVKKSMLEKMFPKQGSTVPEVRFSGFTEDWEQRKVGELLIERNQQAPMSEEYPLMAFVANEGVTPKGERYDRSALVTDTKNKLYKKTEFGDFIYSSNNLETGSIGLNKYGKACISPVYSIFKPIDIADSDFLGRRLVRKDFINTMVKWRQGVIYGQWRIHESDFLNIDILVPVTDEQQRIGKLLDDIDHLITLHQRLNASYLGI